MNRHMRRVLIAIGISGIIAQNAFAWPAGGYYAKQWAGNMPINTLNIKTEGPMIQAVNGGGSDGASACVNTYFLHDGQVIGCGACQVGADKGMRLFLPELGILVGYPSGVVKIVVSPVGESGCDPTNVHTTLPNHVQPEMCRGANDPSCTELVTMPTNEHEYYTLESECAGVHQFMQQRCQDP